MVTLSHAIAAAMVHGPAVGLELLRALDGDARLQGNHRLDAARAHLYEMAGDHARALAHYHAAAARTASVPERDYLTTRGRAPGRRPAPLAARRRRRLSAAAQGRGSGLRGRSTSTGTAASCSTASATLPCSSRPHSPRPSVLSAISSARTSAAHCTSAAATSRPSTTRASTRCPSARSRAASVSR
jgi:hypothetical protein